MNQSINHKVVYIHSVCLLISIFNLKLGGKSSNVVANERKGKCTRLVALLKRSCLQDIYKLANKATTKKPKYSWKRQKKIMMHDIF